ncbi:MAG TPA: tetratricopeptide repeat protein [Bacteroidetes bacterium]|nr:tetratricopeptide repeat protein [Bacteroidota bacterium]
MDQNILNDLLNTQGHINEEELNAYLGDVAPPELRHKVENSMLDNPLLADAVEGYQEMGLTGVPAFEGFSEFKKKLPATDGAKIVQLTPVKRMLRVAAVAGLLLVAVLSYFAMQSPSPQALYSDFYAPYKNDISLTRRGDADGLQKDFKYALGLYAAGDYAAAIPSFEKAIEAEPGNDAARFFAGIASAETGKIADAKKYLIAVKNNNSPYARKAFWYSILMSIKEGNMDEAKDMLMEFSKGSGFKIEEAKRLMDKL